MTLKERISEIFDKYSVQLEVEEKTEVKFATATLESGQEIQTDAEAFAVGVSVFVVNDEGDHGMCCNYIRNYSSSTNSSSSSSMDSTFDGSGISIP